MGNIGERIKEIREAQNLNQDEFALQLGISKHALVNYEKGHSSPQFSLLERIIHEFPVPDPVWFMLGHPQDEKSLGRGLDPMISKLLKQAEEVLEKGGEDSIALAQNIETFHRLIFAQTRPRHRRACLNRSFKRKAGGSG
jgi:transcriptional regulator with XRE-family HTH domain